MDFFIQHLETFLIFSPQVFLVLGMTGVGLSISRPLLSKVIERPVTIAAVMAAQSVLLPLAGALVVYVLRPSPEVAAAILLISVCPGGGLSNLFTLIAKANVTLSVVMTLAGLALAGVTLPAALEVFRLMGLDTGMGAVSTWFLSLRLMVFIAAPVLLGLVLREKFPELAKRLNEPLRKLSFVLLFAILAAALAVRWDAIVSNLWETFSAVSLLFGMAISIGWIVGRVFFKDKDDRFSVTIEFAVRNLSLGTAIGLGFQGNFAFVGTGAVYLLVEGVFLLTAAFTRKSDGTWTGKKTLEAKE